MAGALLSSAIIFGAVMLWIGVQALARKSQNLPSDCDMLGDTGRGCRHCGARGNCDSFGKE